MGVMPEPMWRSMAGLGGDLELSRAVMTVQVRRQPRGKCSLCNLRRVRYRIAAAMAAGTGETDARCAECWGITA